MAGTRVYRDHSKIRRKKTVQIASCFCSSLQRFVSRVSSVPMATHNHSNYNPKGNWLLTDPQRISPKLFYSSSGENADTIYSILHRSHRRQRPHSPPNHLRLYAEKPFWHPLSLISPCSPAAAHYSNGFKQPQSLFARHWPAVSSLILHFPRKRDISSAPWTCCSPELSAQPL